MRADLDALQAVLGHSFHQRPLLIRALTHKSRLTQKPERHDDSPLDNEQLEFLGDSILGFLVSEWLFTRYPEQAEGDLSKRKAYLVSAKHLVHVAHQLELGQHLRLGRSEEANGGRTRDALLANAVEAVLAALYLDGGIDCARAFVTKIVLAELGHSPEDLLPPDHKTALQERAQALRLPMPQYTIVNETGPQHARIFVVEVRVGPQWVSRAEGTSKKAAGQRAAELLLRQLK